MLSPRVQALVNRTASTRPDTVNVEVSVLVVVQQSLKVNNRPRFPASMWRPCGFWSRDPRELRAWGPCERRPRIPLPLVPSGLYSQAARRRPVPPLPGYLRSLGSPIRGPDTVRASE
jgi:hypothetical protein